MVARFQTARHHGLDVVLVSLVWKGAVVAHSRFMSEALARKWAVTQMQKFSPQVGA